MGWSLAATEVLIERLKKPKTHAPVHKIVVTTQIRDEIGYPIGKGDSVELGESVVTTAYGKSGYCNAINKLSRRDFRVVLLNRFKAEDFGCEFPVKLFHVSAFVDLFPTDVVTHKAIAYAPNRSF